MIFEALNNNVMLVEVTGEEMERLDITYDLLGENDERTRSAIRRLLRTTDAQNRVERGDRVTVEAMPTDDGGCFFIFTFYSPAKRRYRVKKNNISKTFCAATVDDFLDFISAAGALTGVGHDCSVYFMDGAYYLIVPGENGRLSAVATEFGSIGDFPSAEVLGEYGTSLGKIYLQ